MPQPPGEISMEPGQERGEAWVPMGRGGGRDKRAVMTVPQAGTLIIANTTYFVAESMLDLKAIGHDDLGLAKRH